MVAEPWIVKIGSQVSSNIRHKLLLEPSKRKSPKNNHVPKQTIGILSFEVATVMSKTVLLHKSLTDSEISKLKTEVLKSEGVLNLVSSDEVHLLELALSEKLDDLNRVSSVVSRLGKKCTEPALQGFEHVYGDVVSGVIDVKELGFLVKDMEGMVRKMERLVNATANLYTEMEVLNELEQSTKKFQHNQHKESKRAFEEKLIWRRQDVRHLKEISLWNQTYDKVVELLARTVCTIYSRICIVFGDPAMKSKNSQSGLDLHRRLQTGSGTEQLKRVLSKSSESHSVEKKVISYKSQFDSRRGEVALFRPEELSFPCGTSPGRLFMDCLSLSCSVSKFDEDDGDGDRDDRISRVSRVCISGNAGLKREHVNYSNHVNRSQTGVPFSGDQREYQSGVMQSARFGPKSRLTVYAPSTTVGGSALALHYANVIIIIEKLLRYPHLVGEEARDDLYQMLPTSLRMSLRTNLKSYVNNLAIYDAPLAHDWKDNLDGILKWLAPLAHNMIRWQSERNFEQHQIVTRTNVLLLQTLYFADREKTEAALCELLVGLNYICRYEHQQNALLDCASSFDFEDCMEWQLQCGATYLH
ncbi:protein PSK SIMULATOR 1-like [Juglans microcarpa x Juglans regia]|uniref:protein PSK SIMULATOR 1-like n=1 Tax=Juglans microcarpa x Juglans regia TaxID=2249226 RepID=UPI001B7E0816|nr:protein PSK SIMULATOR 1-like [Juglans microcarpa x Juglans regia]